ncbi:MAG: YebC/PmpR family DNA-binding transcriptional regulator [Opitutae bacterium]|jgi:YebC/PmpR family DNA-binding regulatory protein|nr:YebC/PmpR family DNA-binding transcriptional regulator [Opitutae bacterium]MBO25673.1 YebC/PmpR family DNA-binding transcriptional regulator [Opitutales bacterium]HAY75426.1 YebC/PmpR family DNA-binding transcriptional regulator [Opitutae bacterium]HBJ61785.1 YebC/PmpR family DNA-binding transcriptional regulator [Opitutae bacterium]|tara:strand:- start:11321 stop:12073 length:753 start_codon:yes stop_codon:yes gene_type:complete
MSGHSKWATTKRHKAAVDAKRGKIFSVISKELTLAARDGGKDPEFNPRLRTLITKAKQANMPADNIERAIKKGTGELAGVTIEELLYEGYAPGGVGLIVEVTTDNKNRSASEVRSTFSKGGGNLAGAGALAFNFKRKGQILLSRDKMDEDSLTELALENDAEDIVTEKEHYEIICETSQYDRLAEAFDKAGIETDSSELAYLPNNLVPISDHETARKILKLIESLEDLEDVKAVHGNYDMNEALLEEISS